MTSGIRFRPSAFTQRAHPHEEFPRVLEIQVISFMRLVWHDLFDADDRLPERVWEAPSSLGLRIRGRRGPRKSCAGHDVRVSNRSSHAASGGSGERSYLSPVSTREAGEQSDGPGPASQARNDGYRHALPCQPLVPFYSKLGWRTLPRRRVL